MSLLLDDDMQLVGLPERNASVYRSLGLIDNPFAAAVGSIEPGVECETASQGNKLLVEIVARAQEETPKPIIVRKADLPSSYHLSAISRVESSLAADESISLLYAYVQLFMMKVGATRATLGVIAERLAFRDFEITLQKYLEKVLASPDDQLASYQVLGAEALESFSARFEANPREAISWVFGDESVERHAELGELADVRQLDMDDDVDESEVTAEIDSTIGDAPGTLSLATSPVEGETNEDAQAVLDYVVEYTKQHASPVIARGLRVYHDRGLAALAGELKITKAPRKTLAKIAEFARVRYGKLVFIYDAFESWHEVASVTRSKVVGSLSSLRWLTASTAFMVFMLAENEAPEVEETFAGGTTLEWDFPYLARLQQERDVFIPEAVESWLSAATLPGADGLSLSDSVLSSIREQSEDSLRVFLLKAHAAIESAAARGVAALDDEALAAASAVELG